MARERVLRKKTRLKTVLLAMSLILAAASTLMLVDIGDWFQQKGDAAPEPTPFPGIDEPSLTLPAETLSGGSFNALILGLDHGDGRPAQGNERSDVIIVAHIDEAAGRAALLSIPRDSYVSIPGYYRTKINEAYNLGGPELSVKTVEQVTGMQIRNYVVLDFDEFKWLVDLFGGVQITMDEALSDPKLGYIPAGNQDLDGSLALVLARSRDYPSGDLERVRQQQRLLVQILYKGKEMASLPGAAWFLTVALEPLETDLDAGEVIGLAREFATYPVVDVQGGVAPGRSDMVGGASVYLLDEVGLKELVESIESLCFVPEQYR